MLINQELSQRLQKNWSIALSAECFAEARVYDSLSHWQCWLLAQNPESLNTLLVVIAATSVEMTEFPLSYLESLYNADGEGVTLDTEYRPIMASQLFKTLNERFDDQRRD